MTCPRCGDVAVQPKDVELFVAHGKSSGTYSFRCPGCQRAVRRTADTTTVRLLTFGEVTLRLPGNREAAPPLQLDDLIDLHQLLSTDGWFDRFFTTTDDSASGVT